MFIRIPGIIAITLALLLNTFAFAATHTVEGRDFEVQGHKAGSGLARGNTAAAIHKAGEVGADSIEIDIQVTADGYAILGHDDDIKLTCEWTGDYDYFSSLISWMQYEESQLWDCDPNTDGVQPYPTVEEALSIAADYDLFVNLEIKPISISKFDNIMNRAIAFTEACDTCAFDKLRVSSFHLFSMIHAHNVYQPYYDISVSALTVGSPVGLTSTIKYYADVWSPADSLLTEYKIQKAKKRGLKVIPYTINDPDRMRDLITWGVDGIITDYPDVLKGIVENWDDQ